MPARRPLASSRFHKLALAAHKDDAVSLFLGADIGGTTSTIAIGDAKRRIVSVSNQFPTHADVGPAAAVEAIVSQTVAELDRHRLSPGDLAAASIASPGPATVDGVLSTSPNLTSPDWDGCDIRETLRRAFARAGVSIPVRYIGDGQAAALGEYSIRRGLLEWDAADLDADRSLDSLFMVTVGTGLGGGEVRDGRVTRGSRGRAGHAGHIMLPHDAFRYDHERELRVGNSTSTAEAAISLTALTHQLRYRLSLDRWRDHPLNRAAGSHRDKAKRLRELAAEGDALATELIDDQAAALGVALLCLNYVGDYDLLVVGGGVCDLIEPLRRRYLKVALRHYRERALNGFRDPPPVKFSVCGDHASVVGAVAFATPSVVASESLEA